MIAVLRNSDGSGLPSLCVSCGKETYRGATILLNACDSAAVGLDGPAAIAVAMCLECQQKPENEKRRVFNLLKEAVRGGAEVVIESERVQF